MNNPATANGILRVDLSALADNYNFFQDEVGSLCEVAGVVKANAYGTGIDHVLPALEKAGCRFFYVATLDEAIHARTLTKAPVAAFGGLYKGAEEEYIAHNILPVLSSLDDMARWRALAKEKGKALPCLLHIDTAMNRLGLGREDMDVIANDLSLREGLDIKVVLTHFASSDEKDSALNEAQYKRFSESAVHFPKVRKSLANSSGILRGKRYHFDMVRPGMALYGLNPTPETDNPMSPVVELKTRLLQVRKGHAGDTVGYNATYTIKKDTRIGTVAMGYADGFLRSGSSRAALYYQGKPCPIIGRVSMDLITVDLGTLDAQPGQWLEVIGPNQSADALAKDLGTIGYEVLTSLGPRWHREYKM